MLSSYERGRQTPKLDSLDKILDALGVGLAELENAVASVRAGEAAGDLPPGDRLRRLAGTAGSPTAAGPSELYDVLGQRQRLPAAAEEGFVRMMEGLNLLLRSLAEQMAQQTPAANDKAGEPS